MKRNLINFILFQIGWFACVLSAANQIALIGLIVAVFIMFIHIQISSNRNSEILLLITAMVIGAIWDSAIVLIGWLSYESGMFSPYFAPYWIIAMWGLFATTVNISLSWMKDKILLAAIFGGVAGPLAYYAGFKLGAVNINNFDMAMISLSIGWAFFTPLLLKFTDFFRKRSEINMREAL